MKNNDRDFDSILKCLYNNNEGIECLEEDKPLLNSLILFFSKLQSSNNRPDAFAENETTLFLLEHFQFDNSKLNKKGSIQNQTSALSNKKICDILKTQNYAMVNENVKKSGFYYIRNFQKQFNSHAEKIDSYKLEIQKIKQKQYDKYIMGFVIEDSSPLGSIYFSDKTVKSLNLLYAKEFLDLFEKTTNLDFVIFAMTGNVSNKILSFISRNTIPIFRKYQIVVANIQKFLFEDMICASSKIFISDN